MKKYIIVLSSICAFISCKKKDPVETTESPVFSFTGNINGNYTNYMSGVNGYYMVTSYSTDANNVKEFIGELKSKTCSGSCTNSIKLKIKDYRDLSGPTTNIDSSISTSYYAYSMPAGNASAYSVTLIPQFIGGTPQTYLWTFDDATTSSAPFAVKIYPRNGKYLACLNITSTSACSSSLCNTVKIGQTGNEVESNFTVGPPAGNVLTFTAQPVLGTPPYSYNWNFGDGNNATVANPTHTYSSSGNYLVSLIITDSKNNSSTFNNNVNTQVPGACTTRFSYIKAAIANPLNLSNVILEWTDSNGTVYTSENNGQPITSGFKIVAVENYLNNEYGQKTKKITAQFNCWLYNGTNSVLIEDAKITFALAYP
jgi:PKD repeat protein